jgi:NADPH2:quinone reductase
LKAVVCATLGGPEGLAVKEVPVPPIGPTQVRIGVHACGVNFADTLLIAGKYQLKPSPPFIPGLEVAGEVLECGYEVRRCRAGDRVLATPDYGGFAEQLVVSASDTFVIPDDMDAVTAAGFPITYGTSHIALHWRALLRKGEVLVVHGAAGGAGLSAIEIGKAMGAKVIGTAGGAAKQAVAAAHGADHLIDYRNEDVKERIKALTNAGGADVIYDPVGGDLFDASLRSIAWGGRILLIGFASGHVPQIPANIVMVKNVSVLGVHWGSYRSHAPSVLAESFAQLFAWYRDGLLKPHVADTYPLDAAGVALRALLDRNTAGKLVLVTH